MLKDKCGDDGCVRDETTVGVMKKKKECLKLYQKNPWYP